MNIKYKIYLILTKALPVKTTHLYFRGTQKQPYSMLVMKNNTFIQICGYLHDHSCVIAGFLQISMCTKPTLHTTLQITLYIYFKMCSTLITLLLHQSFATKYWNMRSKMPTTPVPFAQIIANRGGLTHSYEP